MAKIQYEKIPIVDAARRCGLVINSRTLRHQEVEATCPFCGDHGPGKYHLSLNTLRDQYRCNLCGARGNSVSLYARLHGVSNKEAYEALRQESKIYPMPQQPQAQNTEERQPLPLAERHAAYSDMLEHLALRLLAALLRSCGHELLGLPGFRTHYGAWTISGPTGFLIPVRDQNGLIQGLKIRLDEEDDPGRKYRWLSSRGMTNGTRSYSWVHITGNIHSKRAFLTEGPLKGDVASFLSGNDALFVCIGGVNAIGGLSAAIRSLGVTEVVEAMDMDQMTKPQVRGAIQTMRQEIRKVPGIRYSKYTWNPAYKGVDDYLLSRVSAQ